MAAAGLMTALMLIGLVAAALVVECPAASDQPAARERRSTGLTETRGKPGITPAPPSGTRWARSFDWPPRHSTPPSPNGPRRSSAISRSMPAARPRARSSGATSGARLAAMSSCWSAPRRASAGWRFRPTEAPGHQRWHRGPSDSGMPSPENGFATWSKMPGQIEGPTFSSDGSLVAAAERNTDVASPDGFSIWEVASGRRLARLPMGRGFDALACAFLPGGGFLGSGYARSAGAAPARAALEPGRRSVAPSVARTV